MPMLRRKRPGRRTTRRRNSKMRRNKKVARQVHHFKRTAYYGTVTASISSAGVPTPVALGLQFGLNQLPGVTDFTNLFDQYKISGIKVQLTPAASEGIVNPATTTSSVAALGYSRVHSVIDYDDASAPTGEDQLLEYGSHKSTSPFSIHTRFFKPKVLHEIYRSAVSTSYSPRSSSYIDIANTDVPHYGMKIWISAPNTFTSNAASIAYKVYYTYYFTCKNTR